MNKKKICIVTGSRAEWGLLCPLATRIKEDKEHFTLQLVVTGMHLDPDFGLTYKDVEESGIKVDEKVDISLGEDTSIGVAKSTGLAITRMAEAYKRLKPDMVVLLGDRFEIFGAAAAALISRIPIAHIHGGELTEGAVDDAFRHSVTKMSHLHFTSTEEYRKRVIQLGENPENVYNVGALGVNNIKNMELLSKGELEKDLDFTFGDRNFLITFHPVTLEDDTAGEQFDTLLKALDKFKDIKLLFTKANADVGGKEINRQIDDYVRSNSSKSAVFASMGQLRYLSTLQFVDAVVGNSSSGIIEAPSFKIGTINVGDRQKGRVRAESIIDCAPSSDAISEAITTVYSDKFQNVLDNITNPYGKEDSGIKIKEILKKYNIPKDIKKKFYDIPSNTD